uniref:ACB domain-containing protein n=1 Tax=Scophthalmus maximus TaxID=52904 RepID=A0A8D3DH45_SCOMX
MGNSDDREGHKNVLRTTRGPDCSYRPSYEVMLRFYSLYKQAVCGPCTASRPGFWDPVGRYKWCVRKYYLI